MQWGNGCNEVMGVMGNGCDGVMGVMGVMGQWV